VSFFVDAYTGVDGDIPFAAHAALLYLCGSVQMLQELAQRVRTSQHAIEQAHAERIRGFCCVKSVIC